MPYYSTEDLINAICEDLRQRQCLAEDEADGIQSLITPVWDDRVDRKEELEHITLESMRVQESPAASRQRLRERGLYEPLVAVPRESRMARSLLDLGVARDSQEGVVCTEPLHHGPLRIAARRAVKTEERRPGPFNRCYHLMGRFVFEQLLSGLRIGLPSRQDMIYEAHFLLCGLGEPSFLFGRTPAILNPFEVSEHTDSRMQDFLNVLREPQSAVYYVCSASGVAEQIRRQIHQYGLTLDQLCEMYAAHFARYALSTKLKVFIGDNSQFTRHTRSIPYVSPSRFMFGSRDEHENIVEGYLYNKGRAINLVGKLPLVGKVFSLPADIGGDLLDRHSFAKVRERVLHSGEYTEVIAENLREVLELLFPRDG